MGIQLSGFNSGLPVEDIISQLLAVERRPIDLLQQRKATINLQKGLYANVKSRVSDLFKSIETITNRSGILGGEDIFNAKKTTSSSPDVVSATIGSTASQQTFTVDVIVR